MSKALPANKPTILDVAKMAGVSSATVSRAIHEPRLLHPRTLRKVQAVMAQQGYIYNAMAGDLSRRKSSVIGLFLPTSESAKISTTAIALQDVVNKHGFPIIINNTFFDASLELSLLRQCRERALSALIFIGCMKQNESMIHSIAKDEIPCAFLWDTLENTPYHYVGIDNFSASYDMMRYLLGLGHRRIAFAGAMSMQVGRVEKRLNGYLRALEEYDIPLRNEYVLEFPPTLDNGLLAMRSFLALPEPPTAVFFASDMLAIGALTACREAGVNVPDQVSIAGFDDINFAAHAYPPLTTVRVPAQEMGAIAGHCMIDLLRHKKDASFQHVLPTSVMIRETCAPPQN
jgi:DNA-binding LacI/PurR family transcriptional regulator